jgi:2-dehydro-3-deoxyphosphooctonate aldolase (KDO 8-P synthase)
VAAAKTGKVVNVKSQFLAPLDVRHALEKVRQSGNDRVFVTERGFSFELPTWSSTCTRFR